MDWSTAGRLNCYSTSIEWVLRMIWYCINEYSEQKQYISLHIITSSCCHVLHVLHITAESEGACSDSGAVLTWMHTLAAHLACPCCDNGVVCATDCRTVVRSDHQDHLNEFGAVVLTHEFTAKLCTAVWSIAVSTFEHNIASYVSGEFTEFSNWEPIWELTSEPQQRKHSSDANVLRVPLPSGKWNRCKGRKQSLVKTSEIDMPQ